MNRIEEIVDRVIASTPMNVAAIEKEILPLEVPDDEIAVSPWLSVPIEDVQSEDEFAFGSRDADPHKNLLEYGNGQSIS